MNTGRTLLLAVDGLDTGENFPHPLLTGTSLATATALTLHPGGPSEPAPALASLVTGASVAHTGVATAVPLPRIAPRAAPPGTPARWPRPPCSTSCGARDG
ncbi:alkaline phosphatase family protein [Brachybacterium sp. Z12]|uniref:alkaline phosphatase family protein n=1 Tax=Brachybacterium sp. Z12 TaxID=2759167 RepID=UPI00223AF2C2|nr:alkaline phosphatase family protein [Brachybacterium sp. Z12]